jgi:hypothetical protein
MRMGEGGGTGPTACYLTDIGWRLHGFWTREVTRIGCYVAHGFWTPRAKRAAPLSRLFGACGGQFV